MPQPMSASSARKPGFSFALILGVAALISVLSLAPRAHAQGPQSVADIAAKLSDAVVNISTAQNVSRDRRNPFLNLPPGTPYKDLFDDFFKRQQRAPSSRKVHSLGSGFVIDPAGIIITNNHVIKDADEIVVKFTNREELPAKVIGRDPETDLAVLKVEPKTPLKAVTLGDSNVLRVGDWVMAIGNPFGLGGTVTLGIVSARNRRINSGLFDNYIQTDAAINRGNSGGPLFNMKGEVIGINTAIISPTGGSIGIGFAVPTSIAQRVIAQLRQFGTTRRGWIGVRIQDVSKEIAEAQKLDKAEGVLIAGVNKNGPADKAGLVAPDIIIEFNGKPVADVRALLRVVAETPVGEEVGVVVWRDGKKRPFKIKVGRREEGLKRMAARQGDKPGEVKRKTRELLGLKLSEITPKLRKRYRIASTVKGVVVTDVDPDSFAATKRMRPGTVITEVDQVPVATPDAFKAEIDRFVKRGRKLVLLTLSERNGGPRIVAIRLDAKTGKADPPDKKN